jgi:maltokinase
MSAYNLTQHNASLKMLREDPTLEWRLRHVYAMTYSYLARMTKSGIVSRNEEEVTRSPWKYIYPWIVERAVYELYYESLYRPLWVSIPVTGLLEARVYKSRGASTHLT